MTTKSSDRISNLPSELKKKILECLPIKDAVRTSILSTKWRYVWASLQNLVFDDKDFISDEEFDDMFLDFVDRCLLLHDAPILKFHLMMEFDSSPPIDRWILVVSRKEVENFRLVVSGPLDDMYKVHSSLFSCHELKHLWLANCVITLPRNFKGLDKLNTLRLHEIIISNCDLSYLVSSCTQLQQLELVSLKNDNSLDIEGKEEKRLTISKFSAISILANSDPIDEDMNATTSSVDLPTNLLAGQFIVQMKVRGGELIVPQNFEGLDKLKTFELNDAMFSPDELENLILNCTQLNELSIFIVHGPDKLKIHSNSLQCLKINGFKHVHLVAPLLHNASFNLCSFQERRSKARFYYKMIEENIQLMEVMANLRAKLSPTSTFNHLVNLSLTVIFGDLISEYALFCFMEKAKAVQSLEIKAISLQKDCPNIWKHVMSRNSKFIFDQLLFVRFEDFLGTENELSFLSFILAASPALKKVTIQPGKEQLVKSTQTYRKLLKSKKLSIQSAITFV
ncbi:RNI-like protein [Dioscorea alata]|uniref:RNI-like protein n=3 Tax=Dioscorea alata TaxID=55571 RepID=A0ACB7WJM5_DIOAL|nr:RNI-like protein [Dioscorea alata]KAH7688266.1 RNI-like protein [Dioscorea alata]KAH7688267.1 RNI-like protein [Dioscorea alata]